MNSEIGFPIVIGAATIFGFFFFWCTYRHQREPVNGRGSEDSINAAQAANIRRELYIENNRIIDIGETTSAISEPSDKDDLDP